MKGIILAGGNGTRLNPLTCCTSKQLLPIYDKPLIFYPLATLMELNIREIAIIIKSKEKNRFFSLLGNGEKFGVEISYLIQDEPNGLAEAFIIAENFIRQSNVTLILGDNIFYGDTLKNTFTEDFTGGAKIFCCKVNDPERYGVAEIKGDNVVQIIEKPIEFISHYAVTGIYAYDNSVVKKAKSLTPSPRGELEITDLNNLFIKEGTLRGSFLDSEMIWMDTGTFDSLHDASSLVKALQNRSGHLIGSPELAAYHNNWISKQSLTENLNLKNPYDDSLLASLN
ncbi:sugar phosphate nucleotidyltransferase [Gammaproteobacteria bacterium]|nr:sugar phosphate nucleotidyltransferase [Gammaproteobacteria bacterium]